MGAQLEKVENASSGAEEIRERFEAEGLTPQGWGNHPHDSYGWHSHSYHKVLYCVSGSLVFHTHERDLELGPGDRMEIEPGTEHAATVGPAGGGGMEAARRD